MSKIRRFTWLSAWAIGNFTLSIGSVAMTIAGFSLFFILLIMMVNATATILAYLLVMILALVCFFIGFMGIVVGGEAYKGWKNFKEEISLQGANHERTDIA